MSPSTKHTAVFSSIESAMEYYFDAAGVGEVTLREWVQEHVARGAIEIAPEYIIPESNFDRLNEGLEKVSKQADKLGVDRPRLVVLGVAFTRYEAWRSDGTTIWPKDGSPSYEQALAENRLTGRVERFYRVRIHGAAPIMPGGWTLAGTLSPVELEDGTFENLLKSVPGVELPTDLTTHVGRCDHCGVKRMRNETYVVRNAEGEFNVVGSSCIKDFLGSLDPNAVASMAQIWGDVMDCFGGGDEEGGFGGGRWEPSRFDLRVFLRVTAAVIRKYGWASKASCEFSGVPTSHRVSYVIDPPRFTGRTAAEDRRRWEEEKNEIFALITGETKVYVEAAIKWARQLEPAGNDYLTNLKTACRMKTVSAKEMGITASLLAAFDRDIQRSKEREERNKRSNEFVGHVGEQIIVTVTLEATRSIETQFGPSKLYMFVDEKGNSLKWFSSSPDNDFELEKTYRIKGTVKKHDEYKGRKQTMLTRVSEHIPFIELTNKMVEKLEIEPCGQSRKMSNGWKVFATPSFVEELKRHPECKGATLKRVEKVEF